MLAGASLLACSKPSSEPIAKRSERLVITDGLVAAYDFDESSGTITPDISGNGVGSAGRGGGAGRTL